MKPRATSAKAIAEREGIRTCIACGRTLPVSEFSSHSSRCTACRRLYKEQLRRSKGILARDHIQQEAKRTGFITCIKCHQEKPLKDFDKNGTVYRTQCKECRKKYSALWYKANKDTVRADYLEANKEQIKTRAKQYYGEHRDALVAYSRKYYADNTEQALLASKAWREANPERRRAYMLEWQEQNREHRKKYKQQYNEKNAEKIRAYRNARQKYLRDTDPLYKLKGNARNLILKSFKRRGFRKNSHTARVLGCTWNELQDHLFSTWRRNYGTEWNGEDYHIDHIIPLATATTEQEVIELCHYTNLQMLTPEDNEAKNDSLEWSLDNKQDEINNND